MINYLINRLEEGEPILNEYADLFREMTIASKIVLIKEGDVSRNIYIVKKGCLRLWFINQGKDVTFQFFFENQAVSSFFGRAPSMFNLESIEPSSIIALKITTIYYHFFCMIRWLNEIIIN